MATETNLQYLKSVMRDGGRTYEDLATLTEYSVHSVKSWFVRKDSVRFREVPDRAVTITKLKLSDQ